MKLSTKSLNIGVFLKDKLSKYINIYPIIADKSAEGNFAVYRRTGLVARNTKDIYDYETSISIEISIITQTYKEGIVLSQQIKDDLEGFRGKYNDTLITGIFLENANEDWSNDAYIQTLFFIINVDERPLKER